MQVCHDCPTGDNPSCVNPLHLFLGTNADNHEDKMAKGRQARGERIATAKMTADQVIVARFKFATGNVSRAALAREYGISERTMGKLLRRECWKHVS
ncbi:MAG: hypothetical protein M3440_08755 [Chloroflexota bacterium]|nr:hypothetical protein [Chloroflexota bacterium]